MSGGAGSKYLLFILCAAAAGLVLRLRYALMPDTLDGDSAVFALMAQRIAERGEHFVFMPLNHYAGALSAYLGALLFNIFGVSTTVYNITGLVMSLAWCAASCLAAFLVAGPAGLSAAAALTFLAPFQVMMFSIYPGGVQAETLLFGGLVILLIALRQSGKLKSERNFFAWSGLTCGIGLWLTPGILPFIAAVLFMISGERFFRKFFTFLPWFLLGFLPSLVYNVRYPGATLFRLAGRALDLDRRSALSGQALFSSLIDRFHAFPGCLADVFILFSSLAGAAMLVVLLSGMILYGKQAFADKRGRQVFLPSLFIIAAVFLLFYSLVIQERAERFLLALYVVLPFFAAVIASGLRRRSPAGYVLFIAALVSASFLTYLPAVGREQEGGYAGLADWLEREKITSGFSDYWTAYPVIFESSGKVILSPTLFHPDFSDRFPEYTRQARRREQNALVVNEKLYPGASSLLQTRLKSLDINYSLREYRGFSVFYGFSRKVLPEELNLYTSAR